MIKGFKSRAAEDIYDGMNSRYARKIPNKLHDKIQRLLDQLNAVTTVETLRIPPSNHLEKLTGNYKNYWSLRINKQWRVIFKWIDGNVTEVDIVDYH